jgi:dissimilatory sulfite reductase related protein
MTEEQTRAPDPKTDDDGFLKTVSGWTRSMAITLAEKNEFGPLNEEHWKVIEYVKSYYDSYDTGPPVVKISKATGLSRDEICRLFPCGVVRGAYRLAGLPRPPGCF